MKRLLILVMLAATCGFTQGRAPAAQKKTPAAPPARWPIQALKVEGNKVFTAAQVVSATGLKVGQMAGKSDFDAARDRLLATGAFETAGYSFAPDPGGKGYIATFQVAETPTLFPVHFQELPASPRDLEALLRSHDPLFAVGKMPATRAILDRDARWIEEYLAGKGTPEHVRAEVASTGPDQFEVVFRPDRNPPVVAHIVFQSADPEHKLVIPPLALQDAVFTSAVGMPFTEAGVRDVLNAGIKPLYEARGRLHVTFPEIRSEPATDVKGVKVTVKVNEGDVYTLGNVSIASATPIDPAVLLKQGDFKSKDIANFERVNEGLERIRKAFRRGGYLDAKVTGDRKLNEEKKTVDVAVTVDPGPQYTMGKLEMKGLDLEGEAEMKRMWTLTLGKPFNAEYPDHFLKTIKDEGVFDHLGNTKADTKINPSDHTVDVTLIFTPPPSAPSKK